MKKILFLARDPGGANSLINIIKNSLEIFDCYIYAKDYASTIFHQNNIIHTTIKNIKDINILNNTDLIFTGTSFQDNLEHEIWEYGLKNKIPTIAYLDHWMGYNRFYNNNYKQFFFPKILIVTDEIAKKAFLDKYEKHDKSSVLALGSTFLQKTLLSFDNNIPISKNTLVYAAEKIKGLSTEKKYGFNEYDQFQKLVYSLEKLNNNYTVYFIPHPKHNLNDVKIELCSIKTSSYIKIVIYTDNYKETLIQSANKIFGINTMVLVEAMILGKETCSIQIGIKEESDFQLTKYNHIFNANTEDKLLDFLNDKIKNTEYNTSYILNSEDKIMECIKRNV